VSSVGNGTFNGGAVGGATGATGATGAATGAATVGDAQFTATGTVDPSAVRSATSGPDVASGVPAVSAESEVSQAAGQQGSTVLRGGGSGIVEGQVIGGTESGARIEAADAARQGNVDARGAAGVAGSATSFRDPQSEAARAANVEFHQRDQAVAQARAAEDAHDEARRTIDDPTAAGTERAEIAASDKMAGSMPAGAARAEANVNLATGAVQDPRSAAQNQAQAQVSAQEREAEAKLGIRGSAGPSREEAIGSASIDDEKKK
jgi:hypothetical protein